MIIKIDSREQKPYRFETETVTGALLTGDYSISGLESLISIERKTIDDLIGCLTKSRERFERELYRGLSLRYFCLVVEASLAEISGGCYRSQMKPKAAIQSMLAFSIRYRMPIFFAENRQYACRLVESLLLKFAREIEREAKVLLVGGTN